VEERAREPVGVPRKADGRPAGSWNLVFTDLNTQSTSVLVTANIVLTTA
jgi:hypothetical protein